MDRKPKIAIIGGTGDLGRGLARCWAGAGFPITLGSRTPESAVAIAAEIAARTGAGVTGAGYAEAIEPADIVVLAVPYAVHDETLRSLRDVLQGKILVDAVVPLVPPKVHVVQISETGCAELRAQSILGDGVRVVSAFHNVGATKLHDGKPAECDVLVFGDDVEARKIVMQLAEAVASRGVDGGPLANSAAGEALTSVLIWINRRYKVKGAGIAITGLPDPAG